MQNGKSTIQRAMELAATGEYSTMTQIRAVLRREGYPGVDPNLAGDGIRRQLKAIIKGVRNGTSGDPSPTLAVKGTTTSWSVRAG